MCPNIFQQVSKVSVYKGDRTELPSKRYKYLELIKREFIISAIKNWMRERAQCLKT